MTFDSPAMSMLPTRLMVSLERISKHHRLPREWAQATTISITPDVLADELAISFVLNIMAAKISETKETSKQESTIVTDTEKVPRTAWDAVKLAMLDDHCCLRHIAQFLKPVQFREIPVNQTTTTVVERITKHMHVAPFPAGTSQKEYITFMQWSKPYLGSMEEYQAIKRIADIVRNIPIAALGNIDLLRAIAEYKRAEGQIHE